MEKRILIVDDDEDILDLLKYNLKKEGYQVKTTSRTKRIVTLAKKFDPDLIILDVTMPDKNGIEVCRKLRRRDRFKDTYIFFSLHDPKLIISMLHSRPEATNTFRKWPA
jgi:two-component system, OmpR family, alkaline phosphatase synthesis response regulator PhoP